MPIPSLLPGLPHLVAASLGSWKEEKDNEKDGRRPFHKDLTPSSHSHSLSSSSWKFSRPPILWHHQLPSPVSRYHWQHIVPRKRAHARVAIICRRQIGSSHAMRCLRVFPMCRPALTLGPLSHPLRFCFHNVSVFPDLPSLRVMAWDTSALLTKDHRSSFYQAFWQPPMGGPPSMKNRFQCFSLKWKLAVVQYCQN